MAASVAQIDKALQKFLATQGSADIQRQPLFTEIVGGANAVNGRDRGHHDRPFRFQQVARSVHAQPLQLGIDRNFLGNVQVALRHKGFGLVVVIVADKVADAVAGKETAKFLEQLGGQRLVVAEDQGGNAQGRDDASHDIGFSRPGYPQQHLLAALAAKAVDDRVDRLLLGVGDRVGGSEVEHAGRISTPHLAPGWRHR